MHKLNLIIGILLAIQICYGQRNFSEVIEVDSANITVADFELFDSTFHIFSIFIDASSNTSSAVNTFNIYNFEENVFILDSFAVSRRLPLVDGKKKFLFGKNRNLEKGLEVIKVSKEYVELESGLILTKGDYNFPSNPKLISSNLYLPGYIEDGDQEYSVISKVDNSLNVVWTKYFNEEYAYSYLFGLDKSIDDKILATSNVYVKEERRYYNQLLKLDTSGNVIWEYFNTEELEHGAVSPWFTTLSDSNIVVSYRVDRFTNDTFRTRGLHFTPYRLIWLDHDGNLMKRKYYVSNRLKRFFVNKVETGLGDYFFLMGMWDDGEALENKNLLLKLNNQGDSLWHRTYYHPDYFLDSVSFSVVDIHEFEDGRIAVLSMISTPYDWNKIWIYMVDSEGNCLTENCISEGDVVSMNTYEIKYEKLTLYPNPTRDRLYWRQDIALQDVRVYDIFGRPVIEVGGEPVFSLNLGTLPAGTYILQGQDRAGKNYRAKFILQ